ncbi:MAG: nitrogenase component 1 [Spirochaetales bacterium]|uniref:Nitrogenase component 1 n=1 Tax=Candidatus Thalassospirochaeta sargassi TaxID=3119039 RepID=A0AAJ1IC85_9SPIO|nr:nitrogenase component 1 [Spirochaetales bacterium]
MEGAVVNPCKACAPLGAALAMKGISSSMSILHGSQGCATYIRRFFIGHFREPVDIASSSFDENTAVFGGRENLIRGISNIVKKYAPEVIGIATSCLAETIGEDIGMYMKELAEVEGVTFIHTDTAAYQGTHINGFMKMTAAAAALAEKHEAGDSADSVSGRLRLNIIPWMVSPADIRALKRLMSDMNIDAVFLPDYSLTLDGTNWSDYEAIPHGGTTLDAIRTMGRAHHTIQFGPVSSEAANPAEVIKQKTGVPYSVLQLPLGLKNTDAFFTRIIELGSNYGCEVKLPEEQRETRGRLLDAYADVHKYLAGLSAAVYGEVDFMSAIAGFLCELGINPAVCMTGEQLNAGQIKNIQGSIAHYGFSSPQILADSDFADLDSVLGAEIKADLLVGNSRGFKSSRQAGLPLVRVGFPVQDRFGGQRILHLGYDGALSLTDRIANKIISEKQAASPVGYMSM